MHLQYVAYDRQQDFHDSKAKYRLFGGAAGPGKTKALLMEAIHIATCVEGCDTLLLRRTFPELESSLLQQFRRDVPRDDYKHYNEAKHVVTWLNGSTTRFGYCRNENDVYQYQGAEFLFIGIDELTHFSLPQWQFLTSRNRCPVPCYTGGHRKGEPTSPCMAGATNPGNIGHAWVKSLWIDKTPPSGFERPEQYDPADYDFIPAKLADNPIYANDANYRKTLESLPTRLRAAFLDGDWSILAGQYFDLFEIGRHTIRAEQITLQPWWPRWISIDWGFQHPSAVYWHCAIPAGERHAAANLAPQGSPYAPAQSSQPSTPARVITYREFVQSGLSPRMLAQAIVERTERDRIRDIFLSPDAFAHRTSEASIAEQIGEILRKNALPEPQQADDDRIGGWQLMYQMLESDTWQITDNCRALIESIPLLIRDERRVEDVRKMDGDDPPDAARYGLISGARYAGVGAHANAPGAGNTPPTNPLAAPRFVTGAPIDAQISRMITAEDPTSRAIHSRRLEAEAKRQLSPKKFPRRPRF